MKKLQLILNKKCNSWELHLLINNHILFNTRDYHYLHLEYQFCSSP